MAEVLCKTVGVIHKRVCAELTTLREKNVDVTQELAYFVRSILGTFKDTQDPQAFFQDVSKTIESFNEVRRAPFIKNLPHDSWLVCPIPLSKPSNMST